MHDLSITLFGSPQISRGEQHITLQRRKDLALLVYLAVSAQPITRDALGTMFWPDSDQSTARANVRKNISRLKNDLGADVIHTTGDQVCLNPEVPLWLDVKRFQSNLEQPRKHNHILQVNGGPLCETCQSALEEAAQLYRGGFLEGFSLPDSRIFDEWQFFQAEGYRQGLNEALQFLIQQHIHLGQYPSAISHCRRWLSLDTLHEPAHRQLMLVYALAGQHASAMRQFEECSHSLKEELGVDPEPETIELYEAIRNKNLKKSGYSIRTRAIGRDSQVEGDAPTPESKSNHNLPSSTTPFVGRLREIESIKKHLDQESCRIMTLLGPGGSGKTRLAIMTGLSLNKEGRFKDGIWLIQLAPLTDQASILPALQKELNISAQRGQEIRREQLFTYLRNRRSLLILDNFEHLLGAESISLISDLVHSAPQIKILITSRERLNIKGENLFPVEGLDTPLDDTILSAPGTDSEQYVFSAIQLFEQSARRVKPSFEITSDNIKTIAQICRHVQGMPLAIELAAAWIEALPLEEIHKEIRQDLDFLKSELHDVPDRQRSLRAVFDSSWVKLSRSTRSTIKALSVFRSSFNREAAQAITGMSAKTLLELTNKSWIQPQKNGRYMIHELLRQFALERLEQDSITYDHVKERYCTYYGNRLSALWHMIRGSNQAVVFLEMEFEFENIRTAWNWLTENHDYMKAVDDVLPMLFSYSEVRGKAFDIKEMTGKMLQNLDGSKDQSRLLAEIILRTARGAFYADGFPIREADYEGVYPVDRENIAQAWELSNKLEHFHALGFWGTVLAFVYGIVIDHKAAIQRLQGMTTSLLVEGRTWEAALAKLHLAQLLLEFRMEGSQFTLASTEQLLKEALEEFNSAGNKLHSAQTLRQLGNIWLERQELHEAIEHWNSALSILLDPEVSEWSTASNIEWLIGDGYIQLGRFDEAFRVFQDISRVNLEKGYLEQAIGALSKESFEKARYGDLADALQIRKQCLDLVRKIGPDYQIAWNEWEMGELMRLSGRMDEAKNWFEQAREKFEKYQDSIGLSFYWRGVGDLALFNRDWSTAIEYFAKGVAMAENSQHNWAMVYSLNGRSRAELGLADVESAASHFLAALTLARKVHDPGISLAILASMGEFYALVGKKEKAVVLGSLVLSHFASWHETKSQATSMLAQLKSAVFPRAFAEAQNEGTRRDIWKTVDEVIDEIQKRSD